MISHVQRRGKTYRYFFDSDADPLTGKHRQVTKGGFDAAVTPDPSATPLTKQVTAVTAPSSSTPGGPRP